MEFDQDTLDRTSLLRQIHSEAGGTIKLQIVRPHEAVALAELAEEGDDQSRFLLQLSLELIRQVSSRPSHRPARCGACQRTIRKMRFSCAIVVPFRDDAAHGMGLAICQRCGTEASDIKAAATGALREVWPDIRPIALTHPAGARA